MTQFQFDPATYLAMIREDVERYDELQEETARATAAAAPARAILELGTGTGETARRVLGRHPGARFVGIDASEAMLTVAREALPDADLRVQRLEERLPDGAFDLVFSALAVHHLDGRGKRGLFERVAAALTPRGRFVLADVVVPADPTQARIPLSGGYDRPDTVDEQLAWLTAAGLSARATWVADDLAVIAADLRHAPPVPELQTLRPDHASEVLAFELANRQYFAASVSDRGDAFFDEFHERFDELLVEREARRDAYYVLVDDDGSVLGRFNLYDIEGDTAEVGYRVAERVAGRGVATAGLRELCRLAVSVHGVRRLRARTTHENLASQRVLANGGFVAVGEVDVAGRPGIGFERCIG